ncbi:galactose mutarotase-like domain-containing protein [Flagelloscypha sp. PMI_526]|nr:galactose mutarotase-like domain-containing protein [Flagelloscypha sp. PMI_526]
MTEWKPVILSLPGQLSPAISLEITPYGLTIHRILVQKDGRTNDIVIAPEDPKHHLERKYVNTVIGRYTNRVPVGTHTVERKGVKAQFTAHANESERVSLHGGPQGFDSNVWTVLSKEDPPTLFSKTELASIPTEEGSHAFFRLISEDGDQGFPGKLQTEVLALVLPPGSQTVTSTSSPDKSETTIGSIVFVYRAKLLSPNTVTPINLTQHWGFNLDASIITPSSVSVLDHVLTLNSDRIVSRDADSLSKLHFINILEDPAHNHTNGKRVGEGYPKNGYDDCYIFKTHVGPVLPTRIPLSEFEKDVDLIGDVVKPRTDSHAGVETGKVKPVAELTSEKSGLKLSFDTNQAAVMFYSNGWSDAKVGARKKIHGGSGALGDGYEPGSAVFLEFHDPLAAFLHPEFKEGEDTLLTSDELYNNYARLDIKSIN